MNTNSASDLFGRLSSPARLQIVQQLMTVGHQGMVAGDLARALDISPNNLSFHLKSLMEVELVHVSQEGRFMRYFANLPLMADLIDYLTNACCSAVADDACESMMKSYTNQHC
ncbi:ArsR family transcriptional regulator [Pelistega indica]|uniref:ArsR family transcriptional regulator n=1 Tax=Pelistega indica TaxID=1414851 RepID=V8FX02_9BURK|nr:metalloregulator ArsR/SmtB family transcription factor [Pelistega indica]ETD68804.1 ArsR family transcriptional regulator [Pelistega indica]